MHVHTEKRIEMVKAACLGQVDGGAVDIRDKFARKETLSCMMYRFESLARKSKCVEKEKV